MRTNRIATTLAVLAVAGVAACSGGDNGENAVVTDTLVTPDTQTVQVPVTVPESAAVVTTTDQDTVPLNQAPDTTRP